MAVSILFLESPTSLFAVRLEDQDLPCSASSIDSPELWVSFRAFWKVPANLKRPHGVVM